MPDAPAGGAPVIPPLPTPTGGESGGSSELASSLLTSLTAAPEPVKAPEPKPEPTPAPKPPEPAKPTAKAPEPTKPAAGATAKPAATAPNFDDPKLSASDLRKHLKDLQSRLTTTQAEKETAIAQSTAKLKELEAKKFWTDDDQKKFDELTTGKAALEKQLYSKNYADSPEYKKLFIDKINEQFSEATEVVTALTVTYTENDEEKTRAGTQADMLKLYNAPSNVERRNLAKTMFGDDFQEALDAVQPMLATRKASEQAIKDKAANYESEISKQQEEFKTNSTQAEQFIKSATDALAKDKPDIFGVPENNPEEATLLKRGFDFVDEFSKNSANLPHQERMAKIALLRANAAAFPRLMFRLEKQAAELEALRAEIAGYRKSDPGEGGEGGGGEQPKDIGGTDELTAEIQKLERAGA